MNKSVEKNLFLVGASLWPNKNGGRPQVLARTWLVVRSNLEVEKKETGKGPTYLSFSARDGEREKNPRMMANSSFPIHVVSVGRAEVVALSHSLTLCEPML